MLQGKTLFRNVGKVTNREVPTAGVSVSTSPGASLAERMGRIKPSATLAATARAARLKAQGRDILSLTAGEPDFDTPAHVAAAGIEAIRQGRTRYTPVEGVPALRDAIVAKFARDNGLAYSREQVLVSNGAKQVLFNLCMALLGPGDEAVIPAPYWVSYPDMTLLAGATPVILATTAAAGFKITPAELEAALTTRTRLLFLNSPCNPSGAGYTRAELAALGDVLLRHPQVTIATDDIYEHIWWGPEPFCSLAAACPALYDRTVTINGLSKSHAMTGWRMGYCGGPAALITAMATIQGQSTGNASSISQYAAIAALEGPQDCVAEMNREYRRRHDLVVAGLREIPGIDCLPGWGTFYAFADVTIAMSAVGCADDLAFTDHLLESVGVAVVPGAGFGCPGHVRVSFAAAEPTLVDALARIRKAVGFS
ncbi:MAG: pyridoxal phosphate-dependent aminotransferase [Gammaproteobacteria bacterium]|nr:pyridoxal phosphate-dependent aminotransferase [Gammaproteobacteria bacterium]